MFDILAALGTPDHEAYVTWISFVATRGETPGGRYLSERGLTALATRMGFSPQLSALWWQGVRGLRAPWQSLPLTDETGVPVRLPMCAYHGLAMQVVYADYGPVLRPGGLEFLPVPPGIVAEELRHEAVASCLLDGLPVERDAALEMLETGRLPVTRAERAVLNVHRVLRDLMPPGPALTPRWIFELHRALMDGVAEVADSVGRLRQGGESVVAKGAAPDDVPWPAAEELQGRLESLCAFAASKEVMNTRTDVVDALLIHLWIAYERPFREGNGRLARVLYYAALRSRHPAWPLVASQVSFSTPFARIPDAYAGMFRDVRADGNDAGYFVHGSLRVLRSAVRRMLGKVQRARGMAAALESRLGKNSLNQRQLESLSTLRGRPGGLIAIEAYRRRHGVAYQTARTDLLRLAELGLLEQVGSGRAFSFAPSAFLLELSLPAVGGEVTAHERPGFSALSAMFGDGRREGGDTAGA